MPGLSHFVLKAWSGPSDIISSLAFCLPGGRLATGYGPKTFSYDRPVFRGVCLNKGSQRIRACGVSFLITLLVWRVPFHYHRPIVIDCGPMIRCISILWETNTQIFISTIRTNCGDKGLCFLFSYFSEWLWITEAASFVSFRGFFFTHGESIKRFMICVIF